jgi:arsenate reductase
MREIGIDIAGQHSKAIDDIPEAVIGTVVTLCAEEVCPVFPGEVRRLHWPFPDPAATQRHEETLAGFRRVRDQIRAKVEQLFAQWPGGSGPRA